MENKGFSVIGMFLIVLASLSVVSAAGFSFTIDTDLPSNVFSGSSYSVKAKFNNSNDTFSDVLLSFRGNNFNLPANTSVAYGNAVVSSLTVNVPSSASNSFSSVLYVDVYNGTELVETLSVTYDANIPDESFCEDLGLSDGGDLKISEFDVRNSGRGDDEEWELLDDIEIEVAVENTNKDDDVDDVMVEIKILDSSGDDVTDDFDLDDEEIDLGKIKDDDEEVAVFKISEVPVDMDDGDYRIYVVAYSDDDDSQCVSYGNDLDNFGSSKYYAEITINRENDRGIMIKDDLTKIEVVCGSPVEVMVDLYNIGDDKEEKVLVNFVNYELGIDEKVIIDDFRSGKKRDLVYRFDMPTGLSKSYYNLDITTYYDWDDDDDEMDIDSYDENSEDDLDVDYGVRLDVLSCSGSSDSGSSATAINPVVNADLVTDDVAVGSDVVIKILVANPTDSSQEYSVSLNGYNSWAKLVSLQPSVVNVPAGQTGEVLVTFNPTADGVQTFNVRVLGSGSDVSQDVSLNVNSATSGSLWSFGSFDEDSSLLYWVAVALVVLIVFLILVILVVAFRRR